MDGNENSYGPPFNQNGGGWYAVERSRSFIKVWFWPRNVNPPDDVRTGNDQINTDSWVNRSLEHSIPRLTCFNLCTKGTPTAVFSSNSKCDLNAKFGENNIIIDLTLCGDYAGTFWDDSVCPGTCNDFVDNQPGAFTQAYFDIGSARIYQRSSGKRASPVCSLLFTACLALYYFIWV